MTLSSPFDQSDSNELIEYARHRGQSNPNVVGTNPTQNALILKAAEDVLRDATLFDPRYRDPLSPAVDRRIAVISTLMQAVTAERKKQANRTTALGLRAALADLPSTDEATLLTLYAETIGWGSIQQYLDLPETTEVKFIGPMVQIYTSGEPPVTVPNPLSMAELERRARLLAEDAGEPLNAIDCQRSLALASGTRATITVPPLASTPLLIFRRGRTEAWTLDDLVRRGTLNQEVADLLRFFIHARISVLVVGATGSGKTALLETLLQEIEGHVVTIEDGAQEIRLLPTRLWTPMVVDAVRDSAVLSAATQNVLRQTPEGVGIGETRSREAGATLALATSDHLCLTTIHAEDAEGGLRRFAGRASMTGADTYEHRFEDALRDTVSSFSLVVTIQYWGEIGRRIVTEVALAAGVVRDETGGLQPQVLPLVQTRVDLTTHTILWEVLASPSETGDSLVFHDGTSTPAQVAQRIRSGMYRAWGAGHTGQTAQVRMAEAVTRGYAALDHQRPDTALAEANAAWAVKRDEARILPLVRAALVYLPGIARDLQAQAHAAIRDIDQAMEQCDWAKAATHLDQVMTNPGLVAHPPAQGWTDLSQRITVGQQHCGVLDTLLAKVAARIERGAARETLSELLALPTEHLNSLRMRQRLEMHVALMRELVHTKQSDPAALTAVERQLAALIVQEGFFA